MLNSCAGSGDAGVRPCVTAGVGSVKHHFKMVDVMLFSSADVAFADEFVFPVGTDVEFVAVVAFTVFLRPACFRILLATLRRCPVRRCCRLFQQYFFFLVEMLFGGFHQRGIDD